MKKILYATIIIVSFFITSISQAVTEIKILRQPGQVNMILLYQTIDEFERLTKEKGYDIKITLQPLGNVSDGVTSMLAGNTDIILGATIPFFLANEKVPGKLVLFSGAGGDDRFMICSNKNIKKEQDLLQANYIAMKALGSSDHFYVKQLSKRITGNYTGLDSKIITLPRKQIASAMQAGKNDIDCAVLGSPLQGVLITKGYAHLIEEEKNNTIGNVYGSFTTIAWTKKNPELAALWIQSLRQASNKINNNPTDALIKFKNIDVITDSINDLENEIQESKQTFTYHFHDITRLAELLKDMDLIKNKQLSVDELIWNKNLIK